MQIIDSLENLNIEGRSAVAIGKFDGIHRGHRVLLDDILKRKEEGMAAVVLTFEPSPAAFFSDKEYKGLTTRDEKRRIFNKLGIDILVEYPLNDETAAVAAEEFVRNILVARLHAAYVVCGTDFSFGRGGMGNALLLEKMGDELNFEVAVHSKKLMGNSEISSSLIRNEVEEGHMEMVEDYIGAPYSVTGKVQVGRQIGRTIGMPTVNLIPDEDKLLPPFGVYKSMVSVNGGHFKGITNIGVNPTVTNENKVTVETHIFDFNEDIYGLTIIVNLLRFIRPERKFADTLELKHQIEKDIEFAKAD